MRAQLWVTGLIVAGLASADIARGEGCFDYGRSPHIYGTHPVTGLVWDIETDGNIVFTASQSGFKIFDFTVFDAPRYIGQITSFQPFEIALVGSYAYAFASTALYVIDVSDPGTPAIVAELPREARDVTVFEDIAISVNPELTILDVSDPTNPQPLGALAEPFGRVRGVATDGDHAYVAADRGLAIVDITDRSAPFVVSQIDVFGGSSPRAATSVDVAGDFAYLASGKGKLSSIDVSDVENPVVLDQVLNFAEGPQVRVSGDVAYVTRGTTNGVAGVDIRDPAALEVLFEVDTVRGTTFGLAPFSERYLMVADLDVTIVDLAELAPQPGRISQHTSFGRPWRVETVGNRAYVGGRFGELRIVSVTDTGTITSESVLALPADVFDLAVAEPYAYLATEDGLTVVDVTLPAFPVVAGELDTSGDAIDVEVADDVAFVVDEGVGLRLLDVSTPSQPRPVSFVPLGSPIRSLALAGTNAFVVTQSDLHVIDVTDPAAPVVVTDFALAGNASEVEVASGFAYVAEFDQVEVVDVRNPAAPAAVTTVPGVARTIELRNGLAYVCSSGNVRVLNVASPSRAVEAGAIDAESGANAAVQVGDFVMTAEFDAIRTYPGQCPPTRGRTPTIPRASARASVDRAPTVIAAPNPFNPRTTLRFSLPNASRVSLSLYEAGGRRLRTLLDAEPMAAGPHQLAWDGRDGRGDEVSSGVYFVRLRADGRSHTARLVLVR